MFDVGSLGDRAPHQPTPPNLTSLSRRVRQATGGEPTAMWRCTIAGKDGACAAIPTGIALVSTDRDRDVVHGFGNLTEIFQLGRTLEISAVSHGLMRQIVRADFADVETATYIASHFSPATIETTVDAVGDGDRFVYSCEYLGGTFPALDFPVDLLFRADRLEVIPTGGHLSRGPLATLRYGSTFEVQIGGPGEVTTNAGFVGGDENLRLILNALTTKKSVTTFIHVVDHANEIAFVHRDELPAAMRLRLSNVFAILRRMAAAGAPPGPVAQAQPIAESLRTLAELHKDGSITEDEFTAAKRLLLSQRVASAIDGIGAAPTLES